MFSRKAISPVVATSLFLVITIVSVVGFQTFFSTYQSSFFADIETKSSLNSLKIEGIVGDSLYIKGNNEDILHILKIYDMNGNKLCGFEENLENMLFDTRLILTFDNNTGYNVTHLIDESGFNNSGIINGPNYTENNCIFGGCMEFDGINDWVNTTLTNLTPDSTISMWIKSGNNNNVDKVIFQNGIGSSFIVLEENYTIRVSIRSGAWKSIHSSTNISSGDWFNVVRTFKGGDGLRLYLNGIQVSNLTISTPIDIGGADNGGLGSDWIGTLGSFFNGTMDEMSAYAKALTPSEVNMLYKSRRALFYEQILPIGIKEIDVSSCNLQPGQTYEVVVFTSSVKLEQKVISK